MKIFEENEKSKAVCDKCHGIVPTTFKYADLKHKGHVIPDILQGFCEQCGESVSIPHQSTYRIKSFLEQTEKEKMLRKEYRVPREIVDILYVIGNFVHITNQPNKAFRILNAYYMNKVNDNPQHESVISQLKEALHSDMKNKGKKKSLFRVSCTFSDYYYNLFSNTCRELGVKGPALLRSIIINAKKDFLDKENPEETLKLKDIALKFS